MVLSWMHCDSFWYQTTLHAHSTRNYCSNSQSSTLPMQAASPLIGDTQTTRLPTLLSEELNKKQRSHNASNSKPSSLRRVQPKINGFNRKSFPLFFLAGKNHKYWQKPTQLVTDIRHKHIVQIRTKRIISLSKITPLFSTIFLLRI